MLKSHILWAGIISLFISACKMPFVSEQEIHEKQWEHYYAQGFLAYKNQDYNAAEKVYLDSLKEAEALGLSDQHVATSCHELAKVYQVQNKFDLAITHLNRAIAIAKLKETENKLQIVNLLSELAYCQSQKKQFIEAEASLEEAIAREKKIPGISGSLKEKLLKDYANILGRQGKINEAKKVLAEIDANAIALDYTENKYAPEQSKWLAYKEKAHQAKQNKDYDKAEKLLYAALKEAKKLPDSDEIQEETWRILADLYSFKHDWDKEEYCQRKELQFLKKRVPATDYAFGRFYLDFGSTMEWQKKLPEAQDAYHKAVDVLEKDMDFNFGKVIDVLDRLARVDIEKKDWTDLEKVSQKMIQLSNQIASTQPLQAAILLEKAAQNYGKTNNKNKAQELQLKAQKLKLESKSQVGKALPFLSMDTTRGI